MFMFRIFFVLFLFITTSAKAEIYFMLPDEIDIQDVNKDISTKTKYRYSRTRQIQNQYKGKLKYKPSDSMIKNDRKSRFYTAVGYLINNSSFEYALDKYNNTKYQLQGRKKFKNNFSAEIGVYFKDNASLAIEYFELRNSSLKFNTLDEELTMQSYFLNLTFESNYSSIVPFFGVGLGAIKNNFESTNEKSKGNIVPAYQVFAGLEFVYKKEWIIYAKYKYFDLFSNIELKKTSTKYSFEFDDGGSGIIIGFKYLW